MKVISFKVSDDVYKRLKKRKKSFRQLFEPYAMQLSLNSKIGMKYTGGIRNISPDLYLDLSHLKETLEKILEVE